MGVKITIRGRRRCRRLIIIVMGVTGSGKTTLGQALAERLGLPFYDADDFHPESNRTKLRSNIPLNDEDRYPWLQLLASQMTDWEAKGGAVLACSALKQHYRQHLSSSGSETVFVYLKGSKQDIAERLAQRANSGHTLIDHFDKVLDGQFRDLEEPLPALIIPIELELPDAVSLALQLLAQNREMT